MYDGDDCSSGCTEDTCYTIYFIWIFLAANSGGINVYNAEHSVVCNDWVDISLIEHGVDTDQLDSQAVDTAIDILTNSTVCMEYLEKTDHNNDGHINFREFTHFGYSLFDGAIYG